LRGYRNLIRHDFDKENELARLEDSENGNIGDS
jgi:hypothetical protein